MLPSSPKKGSLRWTLGDLVKHHQETERQLAGTICRGVTALRDSTRNTEAAGETAGSCYHPRPEMVFSGPWESWSQGRRSRRIKARQPDSEWNKYPVLSLMASDLLLKLPVHPTQTERQKTRGLVMLSIEVSLLKHRGSLGLGTKRNHKPAEGALWTVHSSRKSKPSGASSEDGSLFSCL